MEDATEILLRWKAVPVLVWLALFFVAERLRPAAVASAPGAGEPPGGGRRLLRNAVLWGLNSLLSPLVVVPITATAAVYGLGWRAAPALAWWAGWPGLLLDLLLLDFLIYWWHRANHEVALLWRFHQVHHLDRFLDTTSAVRFHFGEVLLSALARAAVIVLLDIPLVSVLVFEALVLIAAIFHHANLKLPPRLEAALSRLIITPSIHWVHHHRRRADTDSNYGTVFSFWDPLFRSRSATRRTPDMAIGVEGAGEAALPELLLRPFRPQG
jgi:sterol desaturase/sphingolipid hydroxylase (fatty acid hydroxylase superfamily)